MYCQCVRCRLQIWSCCECQSLRLRETAWGLDGWETRGATSYWAGLQSCNISVGVLGLMCTHVHGCMYLLIWERMKPPTEISAQPLPAAACGWVYAAHMEGQGAGTGENRGRERWITSDFSDKNNEEESTDEDMCDSAVFCYRLWQFSPKRSNCFLPDGCKTLLHPSNTSWQQRLHHYWFPFLLDLEKHGSYARRRH